MPGVDDPIPISGASMQIYDDAVAKKRTASWTFSWRNDATGSTFAAPTFSNVLDPANVPGKTANLGTDVTYQGQVVIGPQLNTYRDSVSGVDQLVVSVEITKLAGPGTLATIAVTPLVRLPGMPYYAALSATTITPTSITGSDQAHVQTIATAAFPEVCLALGAITCTGGDATTAFSITIRYTE